MQKLNSIRGEIDVLKETTRDSDDDFDNEPLDVQPNIENLRPKKSKWSDFVVNSQDTPDAGPSETMFLNNTQVVLEVPRKLKNLGNKSSFRCPSISKPSNINHNEDNIDNTEQSVKMEMDSYRPNASLPFSRQLHETNENANFINSSEFTPIKFGLTRKQIDGRAPKKYATPVINHSKWAQFVETEVESEDQDDFNDTSETMEGESNDNFTSKDNSTADLRQYERCNFNRQNNKTNLFKSLHVTKQESEDKKNKGFSICFVPTIVERSSKWAPLVETDIYGNKEDICKSTEENIDNNVGNPITANTLFALCEDNEYDEILDV